MDETFTLDGHGGALAAARWDSVEDEPRYVVLLCHGYGEHIGRYEYVAQRLPAEGAARTAAPGPVPNHGGER